MKTAGFVCVSQFPLIPCVLVAELAELERTATTAADFESLKMQHRTAPRHRRLCVDDASDACARDQASEAGWRACSQPPSAFSTASFL